MGTIRQMSDSATAKQVCKLHMDIFRQNTDKVLGCCMVCVEMCRGVPGCVRCAGVLEVVGVCRGVFGCVGMFWNVLERLDLFWDVSGWFGMF